jgi:hypothetical protein
MTAARSSAGVAAHAIWARAASAAARSMSAGEAPPIVASVSPVAGSVTSGLSEASIQLLFPHLAARLLDVEQTSLHRRAHAALLGPFGFRRQVI